MDEWGRGIGRMIIDGAKPKHSDKNVLSATFYTTNTVPSNLESNPAPLARSRGLTADQTWLLNILIFEVYELGRKGGDPDEELGHFGNCFQIKPFTESKYITSLLYVIYQKMKFIQNKQRPQTSTEQHAITLLINQQQSNLTKALYCYNQFVFRIKNKKCSKSSYHRLPFPTTGAS